MMVGLLNVFFPIWLLLYFPPILAVVLIVNFVIDLGVLSLALRRQAISPVWPQARRVTARYLAILTAPYVMALPTSFIMNFT